MTGLTRILLFPRVLLAAALLMSVNATLVKYACAETDEAATASSFEVITENNELGMASCGIPDGRLHRILCAEASGDTSSDKTGCTVDLANEPLIFQAEIPSSRPLVATVAVAGEISFPEWGSSSTRLERTHRTDRSGDPLPIRLRISSLLL